MTVARFRLASSSLVAAVLAGSACTLPLESSTLDATDEPIRIWGYTASPGRAIAVECHASGVMPTPSEFSPFATIYSTTETLSQAGQTVYAFDEDIVVPGWCWELSVGLGRFSTFVRTRDEATDSVHQHFKGSGYQCLVEEYFGGAGPVTAWETCKNTAGSYTSNLLTVPL